MLKIATLAAAMLLAYGSANAKTWYAEKDGNQCLAVPYSPQQFMDALKQRGMIFTPTVIKVSNGSKVVLNDDDNGKMIVLYSNMQDCKDAIKAAIASGDAVDPNELK